MVYFAVRCLWGFLAPCASAVAADAAPGAGARQHHVWGLDQCLWQGWLLADGCGHPGSGQKVAEGEMQGETQEDWRHTDECGMVFLVVVDGIWWYLYKKWYDWFGWSQVLASSGGLEAHVDLELSFRCGCLTFVSSPRMFEGHFTGPSMVCPSKSSSDPIPVITRMKNFNLQCFILKTPFFSSFFHLPRGSPGIPWHLLGPGPPGLGRGVSLGRPRLRPLRALGEGPAADGGPGPGAAGGATWEGMRGELSNYEDTHTHIYIYIYVYLCM